MTNHRLAKILPVFLFLVIGVGAPTQGFADDELPKIPEDLLKIGFLENLGIISYIIPIAGITKT